MRPISKEQKEMRGTFEPSKEGIEPVELELYDGQRMPAAPEGWPPNIQKLWNDRCRDLFKAGYLAKAFLAPLRRYCFAVMQAEEAEEKLASEGYVVTKITMTGASNDVPSPWLAVLDQAVKTIDKFGAKFGFTPLDVQKIPVVRKEVKEESLLK